MTLSTMTPYTAMTASKIAGKPDLIQINNIIDLCVKITGIIKDFFYLQEKGGVHRPCIAACGE
jgi:hypothetical protein